MFDETKAFWRSCKAKVTKDHARNRTRDPLPPHLIMQVGRELAAAGQMKTLSKLMLVSRSTCEPLQEVLYRDITIRSNTSARILSHLYKAIPAGTITDLARVSKQAARGASMVNFARWRAGCKAEDSVRFAKTLALIKTLTFDYAACVSSTSVDLEFYAFLDPQYELHPMSNLHTVVIRNLGTVPWVRKKELRFYRDLGATLRPAAICLIEDMAEAIKPTPHLEPHEIPAELQRTMLFVLGARITVGKSLKFHHHICPAHNEKRKKSDIAVNFDQHLEKYVPSAPCDQCGISGRFLDIQLSRGREGQIAGSHTEPTAKKLALRLRNGEVIFSPSLVLRGVKVYQGSS